MADDSVCQVVIKDPDLLSGDSVSRLILLVADAADLRFAVLADIEGSGSKLSQLSGWSDSGAPVRVSTLFHTLRDMRQFDWGDFFLFETEELAASLAPASSYPTAVQIAAATVRAVDDTFFYVYTKSSRVVERLCLEFPESDIAWKKPEELSFPT